MSPLSFAAGRCAGIHSAASMTTAARCSAVMWRRCAFFPRTYSASPTPSGRIRVFGSRSRSSQARYRCHPSTISRPTKSIGSSCPCSRMSSTRALNDSVSMSPQRDEKGMARIELLGHCLILHLPEMPNFVPQFTLATMAVASGPVKRCETAGAVNARALQWGQAIRQAPWRSWTALQLHGRDAPPCPARRRRPTIQP